MSVAPRPLNTPRFAAIKRRPRSIKKARIDWLSPKPLFITIMLLGVLLPAGPFLRYEDTFSVFWPFEFYQKNKTVTQAILIYALITACFVLGYGRGKARDAQDNVLIVKDSRFISRTAIAAAFALSILFVILYTVGGISALLLGSSDRTRAFAGIQGLFLAINVLVSICIIWYIRLLNNRKTLFEKGLFVVFLLTATVIISLQGQKSTLFIFVGTLAVIYHSRVNQIRLSQLIVGVVGLFIILMAYHIYKQEYLVLGRVVSVSGGTQFWSSVYDFLNGQIFGNFMQLQTMSVLIEGMPLPLSFQYGATYINGALLIVPRAFFPTKPLPTTGTFTEAFWPETWHELGTTLPPGIFGEAYINFGALGAIGSGLLFGYILGRIHGNYLKNRNSDMALIYYAVMVASMLHYFRGELPSVTYLVLSIAIPCRFFMIALPSGARR